MLTVAIKNAKFGAPVGLYPQESKTLNQIQIDASVSQPADVQNLPLIDYTHIYELIKQSLEQNLTTLESIVKAIYNALKERFPGSTLSIKVRKLHPPIAGQVDYAEVAYED